MNLKNKKIHNVDIHVSVEIMIKAYKNNIRGKNVCSATIHVCVMY